MSSQPTPQYMTGAGSAGEMCYQSEPSRAQPIEEFEFEAYHRSYMAMPTPGSIPTREFVPPVLAVTEPAKRAMRNWVFAVLMYLGGMAVLLLAMPTALAALYYLSA